MTLTAILAIIAAAFVAPTLTRALPSAAHWLLSLVPLGLAACFAVQIQAVAAGQPVVESVTWAPTLGVALAFRLDGLSLLFALLVTGIGGLIVIYAGGYLKGHPHLGRFQLFILAFMASMLGLVTADDIVALFVFWELTSVTSFLLIGFNHEDARARRSALQALLITGGGGMALLAGLVLLGLVTGEWTLSGIISSDISVTGHAFYPGILILLLLAAFTKSAQVPFHFWLPNAMDAPTPVSAYLHSATMVKAGVYLLARLHPALGGTPAWFWALVVAGGVTALWGGAMALRSNDLKKILAYTTLMALGVLILLLGIGTPAALSGFAAFLLAHSLYKGALFMGAGSVDHGTGTRVVDELGGLWPHMRVTGLFMALAALSMAGLPPLLGFIAKELVYDGAWDAGRLWPLAVLLLANASMIGAAGLVFVKPFLGTATPVAAKAHEGSSALWCGPAVLASLSLLFGLWGAPASPLLSATASSVQGAALPVELHLWHGLTPALGLTMLTIMLGVAGYLALRPVRTGLAAVQRVTRIDHDLAWDRLLAAGDGLARWVTGGLQGGLLHRYLTIIFAAMALLLVGTLWARDAVALPTAITILSDDWLGVALALLMLAGAAGALRAQTRMAAILSLSVNGLSVALFFLLYGAPDVGITQLMVETLTAIILVLVLARLPLLPRGADRPAAARALHGLIALGLGGATSAIMLAILELPLSLELTRFFGDTSLLEAHGRNVVNVILVDFRGFDTLGEITVIATAGLGVLALVKARAKGGGKA